MRLLIFCVLAFCAGSSLAQRGITMEYYDEMYEEPLSAEDEGKAKVDMEHLDNVDKDEEKSNEDLENEENGHDIISDYQFEDNRASESNDKQNIVEVPTEPMNSTASDIESKDNNDDEEDSENDGSETDSIVEESYKLDPPADGKNIEYNDNVYDENPENYSSEAENVNDNTREPADFQADSEDIEQKEPEYRENQMSHNSGANKIAEQQTDPKNSPASDIESKDNDDGEEDSENVGSETDSIVEESYKLDPPDDGKNIEDSDNGYDENPENYSSETENVNDNTRESADFQADSEDIEQNTPEYRENQMSHNSGGNEIVEQQTDPKNSPASDIESKDNDDGEEDSENDGSETDSIVEESYKLDPPDDGKNIEYNDNGYDENLENYSSEAENVNENAREPADFQADSEDIEQKKTEYRENQMSHNSGANEIAEQQTEPKNSLASDIESKDNDDDEEDSENDGSETESIVEESYEPDPPADGKYNIDEDNGYYGNQENYSSEAENVNDNTTEPDDFQADGEDIEEKDTEYRENQKTHNSDASEIVEQQTEPKNSPASDIESEENDDDEEDSENYSFETDDIVKESNEFVDSSTDGEIMQDKYSGFKVNLENDDYKVNSKDEPEDPVDSPVDDENRKYHDAGPEENQENDSFEGEDIVVVPLVPEKLRVDDEDVEDNTSGYEENVDYNIDNSVDKPKNPVDLSNDGYDLKDKDTDNEENQESYDSEAYDNVEEPTELGDSLANYENREDSDALVNKVNSYNEEFYKNTNDSAMSQNINYDNDSAFKSLKNMSISEEINGIADNFGNVTSLPRTVSTITEENEDTEPSPTEHNDYVDGILFGSSDIKTIKDDGNENTTDSTEKTSHQNIDPIPIQIPTRTYSSEATDHSNNELGDDLSFNHKYPALYTTDSTNSEENKDYESPYFTASKPTHKDINPTTPVFIALTDETPHFIDSPYFDPYGPPAFMEYYINAQGSGIELNITYFMQFVNVGAYLLVKPGGVYASDDNAIIFSYQQQRMYRFKDVDRLYMKLYTGDIPTNSFHLSVRMLNEMHGSYIPWLVEPPSLSVSLGGSTPTAFDKDVEKKEEFRRLVARMAEQYIADGYIILDNDDTSKVAEPWTNITEVTSCTDEWDGLNCVKVTFVVKYGNYPGLNFKLNDLMRMWYTYREEYVPRLEAMGLKVNWGAEIEIAAEKQKQNRLMMVWLAIGAGALISAVVLVVALWRFSCCKGYTRMPAHGDTESLTKKQPFPALYSEQRLTWDDDKTTKVDLDGYANIGFTQKLLDMDSDDDVKTTPNDRKTISPSDVYQV